MNILQVGSQHYDGFRGQSTAETGHADRNGTSVPRGAPNESLIADIVSLSGKTEEDEKTRVVSMAPTGVGGLLQTERQRELFASIVEMLTGREVHSLESREESDEPEPAHASRPTADTDAQAVQLSQTSFIAESVSMTAGGTVRTADGFELSFSLELTMSRASLNTRSVSLQDGEGTDRPFVVAYNGTAAELTSSSFSFSFSLKSAGDGTTEEDGHGSMKFFKPLLNMLKQASRMVGYDNGYERFDKVVRSYFA